MRETAGVGVGTSKRAPRPRGASTLARFPLVLVLVLAAGLPAGLLQGCSGGTGALSGLGFGGGEAKKAEGVFYSGVAGLTVYKDPDPASPVVGKLGLHEKVTRSRLEKGYAFVATDGGRKKGWVLNARLLWKLPKTSAATGSASTDEAAAPSPTEAATEEPSPATGGTEASAPSAEAAEAAPAEASEAEAETQAPPEAEQAPAAEPEPAAPAPPAPKSGGRVGASVFDPY